MRVDDGCKGQLNHNEAIVTDTILTLNAGSSSIKFSIYAHGEEPRELARGQVENIGPTARLILREAGEEKVEVALGASTHRSALHQIFTHASDILDEGTVLGVGHRITHGGIDFVAPQELTGDVIEKLEALAPLAPLHQPHNLKGVLAAQEAFPEALQIGCFDTGFHRGHPWVNDTFGLPRKYYDKGVRRYGFHGLSYQFITSELVRTEPKLADGKVVVAHLGNGASMCAIRDEHSVASTMGFSALDGLPMGTRCGQLDPGVMLYLMEAEGMSASEMSTMLYRESGLKGLSGMSNDMRELQGSDREEAAQAIEYYVFRIRREIGAMAAVLGGIDGLVFCGGIGENSSVIRSKVCDGMEWLGIDLDETLNTENARDVGVGSVRVMVIPTDEERVIARATIAGLSTVS